MNGSAAGGLLIARGGVRWWLRLEALALLMLSAWLYSRHGIGWLLFLVLFVVPDVSLVGYVFTFRGGAFVYNIGHSYLGPLIMAIIGLLLGSGLWIPLALIWVAHISLDRALGFGLHHGTPAVAVSHSAVP